MLKYESVMHIGIFDSGIGGEAIAAALRKSFPSAEITCVNDHKHMPYGERSPKNIIYLTKKAIQPLLNENCDVIIIACNTATTVAISNLRSSYPNTKFIGIEPMLKPASEITKTKHIAVCATPRTLQSERYAKLKNTWCTDIKVTEPDCSDWASLIEQNRENEIRIDHLVKSLIAEKVDVIVLGCTHYHWIKQRIIDAAGPTITVLEPSEAIAQRVRNLLAIDC